MNSVLGSLFFIYHWKLGDGFAIPMAFICHFLIESLHCFHMFSYYTSSISFWPFSMHCDWVSSDFPMECWAPHWKLPCCALSSSLFEIVPSLLIKKILQNRNMMSLISISIFLPASRYQNRNLVNLLTSTKGDYQQFFKSPNAWESSEASGTHEVLKTYSSYSSFTSAPSPPAHTHTKSMSTWNLRTGPYLEIGLLHI